MDCENIFDYCVYELFAALKVEMRCAKVVSGGDTYDH